MRRAAFFDLVRPSSVRNPNAVFNRSSASPKPQLLAYREFVRLSASSVPEESGRPRTDYLPPFEDFRRDFRVIGQRLKEWLSGSSSELRARVVFYIQLVSGDDDQLPLVARMEALANVLRLPIDARLRRARIRAVVSTEEHPKGCFH